MFQSYIFNSMLILWDWNIWYHLQLLSITFLSGSLWREAPGHGSMLKVTAGPWARTWLECGTSWKMRRCGDLWMEPWCGSGWRGCPGRGPMGVNLHSYPGNHHDPWVVHSTTVAYLMSTASFVEWLTSTALNKHLFFATVVKSCFCHHTLWFAIKITF